MRTLFVYITLSGYFFIKTLIWYKNKCGLSIYLKEGLKLCAIQET